jgi:hypothetical protein
MLDVGDVTTASISNVIVGQTYSFHATCYNTAGLESDPSNSVEYTVPQSIPTNEPPTADPLILSTPANTPLDILLTGSDPENDPLTFHIVDSPEHGSLEGDPPSLVCLPYYSGPDSFSFVVHDGALASAPALVSIDVLAVEDPPDPDPEPDPDPPPAHPTLRILNVTQTPEGFVITWSSVANATYQLLYKHSLTDPDWLPLDEPVTGAGPETSHIDNSATGPDNARRYYSVKLLE